ncbi:MAG: 6-pyruvoyl-tetrahydropterin synthase-related protein [Candidatus Diapherotrites archaeon]|nr:6-pyruvoyl-tetrahydropterin synthase-related protein [Candidatus Diapherotrites archaeon]
MGFQLFQFYPPGFYLFAAFLNIFSFGLPGIDFSFKLAAMLSYALVAVSVFIMMRCFGYSRESSFLSGFLSLFVGSLYGGGIAGTFTMGLIPNTFGLMLLPLCIGLNFLALKSKDKKRAVLAGLAFGLIILSHVFSAIMAGGLSLLCLIVFCAYEKKFKENAVVFLEIAGIAAVVSAWWWIPAIAKYEEHGLLGQWAAPKIDGVINGVLDGSTIESRLVSFLGLAGIAVAVFRRRMPGLFIALALILLFLGSSGLLRLGLSEGELFGSTHYARILGALAIFMAASAGVFLESIFSLAEKAGHTKALAKTGIALIALAAVFYFHWAAMSEARIPLESDFATSASVANASVWLKQNTGKQEIIMNEFSWGEWGRFSSPHILDQVLPAISGKKVIGGNFSEGAKTTLTLQFVPERLIWETPGRLRSLGASYIVTYSETTGKTLEQNSEYEKQFQDGSVRIFKIEKANPTETTAALTDFSEENGKISFETNYPQEKTATLPVNYYPNWTAQINGQPAEIGKNQDNLIALKLPAGKNIVKLEFREMLYEKILLFVSLISTLYFISFFFPELQRKASGLFRKARNSK